MLKFRSMVTGAYKMGSRLTTKRDPRVTRVGQILRWFKIDELPQLINVLKGDMSLIGPRPERPEFVEQLAAQIPFYCDRHCVKPGLTGWAQLSYPYGASIDDARHKLQYDLFYIKNYRLAFDAMILLQTLDIVLWGRQKTIQPAAEVIPDTRGRHAA